MRKRMSFWVTCMMLLTGGVVYADNDRERTVGSGHIVIEGFGRRTFTLNVRRDTFTGVVKGHAFVNNHFFRIRNHIRVDCLNIVGNVGYMSGVIEKSNETDPLEGFGVVFSVKDNGKTRKTPDEVSFVHLNQPPDPNKCRCLPACDFRVGLRDPAASGNLKIDGVDDN